MSDTEPKPVKSAGILPWIVITCLAAAFVWAIYNVCKTNGLPRHTEVSVGLASWAGFGSGFIAEEHHAYKGIRTDQKVIDDATARQTAFRSGQLAITVSSADLFVQEIAQGSKGQIILVTDESAGGDGILATKEIKTVADLKGKKVAYARGTPSHYFLFKVLQKNGLTPADIEAKVFEDPTQAGQAYIGGAVDAAVTFEPLLSEAASKRDGHVLVTSKDYPGVIVDVLVASPRMLNNSDTVDTFINGWVQGAEYAKIHPPEAAEIIARGLKIPRQDTEGMMAGLQFADAARNRALLCPINGVRAIDQILQDAGEFWKEQGVIKELPDLNGRVSDRACEILGDAK